MLRMALSPLSSSAAELAEPRLVDIGLIAHHPGQRLRHLDIRLENALHARAQDAQLALHRGPCRLPERLPVALLVDPGKDDDDSTATAADRKASLMTERPAASPFRMIGALNSAAKLSRRARQVLQFNLK